jgi:hypothetical protein
MAAPAHDPEHQPFSSDDAMAVDPPSHFASRSPSPDLIDSPAAAAGEQQHPQPQAQQHQASPFVPLSEIGGGGSTAVTQQPVNQQQPLQQQPSTGAATSEEDEGGGLQRPCRSGSGGLSAGYESGDDMDVLNMRHCTNCTGTLWGHICMVSTAAPQLPVAMGC